MKTIIKTTVLLLFIFSKMDANAQSTTETDIVKLSKQIFTWELDNTVDSLENLFDDKFVLVSSTGDMQTKKQYVTTLKSGNFVHNNIEVEENIANCVNNTATVVGKGKFTVTVSGNKIMLHLSYMEVFTRPDPNSSWKLLAMQASKLVN